MKSKRYTFKEATKSGQYKGHTPVKEATKGIYKGFRDEDGLQALEEQGEFSVVRKYIIKDLMRNHKLPLSKAKLVVEGMEKIYGTFISAQSVSNSLLSQVVRKIEAFDDRIQKMVSHRGGEDESDIGNI